jgi:cytidylate kinase
MVITIDGPAGAGKSTVARALAARLGFDYLDTGAMYRAVALAGIRAGVDWNRPEQLAAVAQGIKLEFAGNRVLLNGEDVTEAIRSPEVTRASRFAADNDAVRAHLITLQRRFAEGRNVVTEGRDQGSLVFPEAPVKFFLTASPEERARRRWREYQAAGQSPSLDEVLRELLARDARDEARAWGRLVKPPDAIEIDTDGLSVAEVVDRMEKIVREYLATGGQKSKKLGDPQVGM